MDAATWLTAGLSVIAMLGSFAGWLLGSRQAKKDAQARENEAKQRDTKFQEFLDLTRAAAQRAEASAKAAEEQAQALQRAAVGTEAIAAAVTPPRLLLSWGSRRSFSLRNTSPEPATIEAFANPEAFFKLPFSVPVTLSPGESLRGSAFDAHGRPFPPQLALRVDGTDAPVFVPADGRPGSET
ncbi:hypothetical protein [Actinomyces procaprae]|uniref:hypothetical protein n=1 Tax=Actinomyces procaprae TaxID=2560010 RepID=UPI00109D9422|nr:hypothetical protein [Actinomyces procaprae]